MTTDWKTAKRRRLTQTMSLADASDKAD